MAGRERCKTLSLRAGGAAARDYGAGPATLVSLATLGAFLPAAEAKKFSHEDVWEAPFCTLAHLQTLSRAPEDSWHYTGCATCFRKTCDKHDEAGVRPCYSLEATVWDHTATLDARIFTKCVDEVLRAALAFRPGDAVQSQENAEHEIRARKWAVRFVVAHDEAYSGPTGSRAARNTLQVVHVREATRAQQSHSCACARPPHSRAAHASTCQTRPWMTQGKLRQVRICQSSMRNSYYE